MRLNQVLVGDCIEVMKTFPAESIDMVMTSPPYWGLRDYGEGTETVWGGNPNCEHEWLEEVMTLIHENRNFQRGTQKEVVGRKGTTFIKKYDNKVAGFCVKCGAWRGQLGLEPTYQMYVEHMIEVCRAVKRVLKKTGSMYLVLGDTYASKPTGSLGKSSWSRPLSRDTSIESRKQRDLRGLPSKCLVGVPWRVAFALMEDGWILRNDIIWHKPNAMPSSVKDRLTQTYEHIFHFVKARRYYYDLDAIREPHATAFASFNLRVRDVKRGKGGISASGRLKASRKEVESYVYPEKLTKHDVAVGRIGNFAYTDPLHTKAHNIKGKNPGDVFQAKKEPYVGNNPHRMRLQREKYIALHPSRPMDLSHPKGKNPGDYWSVSTKPFRGAHFAVYPETICEKPIKASCPESVCSKCGLPKVSHPRWCPLCTCNNPKHEPGIVLDPMCGSGTTLVVAKKLGRRWIGIDINPDYVEMTKARLSAVPERLTKFLSINGS